MLALETEPTRQALVTLSVKNTVRFYWISAVTYLLIFSSSLLFFYNQTDVQAK